MPSFSHAPKFRSSKAAGATCSFVLHLIEKNGMPISLLLDIVEVASSHLGETLASVFAKVLKDYGISDKVSIDPIYYSRREINAIT
jgi:hypothetical protein